MASPVEAILLLCDAAQTDPFGKIHMLGAGWSVTSTPTAPSAVAVILRVPWDRTNQKIPMSLLLATADGKAVSLPGVPKIGVESIVEVGRPAGMAEGSMIDYSFQLTLPSMPLPPGRYQWRLEVGGTPASYSFEVRASQPGY